MNRTHHVARTVVRNIFDASEYPRFDVHLLDYGSTDGLGEYIQVELMRFVESGKLTYWRTEVDIYSQSRAKNIGALLGRGEILLNLDADNFLGPRTLIEISREFDAHPNSFMSYGEDNLDQCGGRVAMRRDDFLRLRGYDETFQGYGYEDVDLARRAERAGLRRFMLPLPNPHAIPHANKERTANMAIKDIYASSDANKAAMCSRKAGDVVNPAGWGQAVVFRNFSQEPIRVGIPPSGV